MPRSLRLFGLLFVSLLAQSAFGATVSKVDKGQERAILKLGDGEGKGLKAGDSISFDAGGETVEAEVLGVSGKSVRVKIVYGIDSLKDGQRVTLGGGQEKAKVEAKEKPAPKAAPAPRHEREDNSPKSDFVLGAGGRGHPFAGDLRAPFVMGSPGVIDGGRVYGFINPSQITRVQTYAVAGGIQLIDAQHLLKNDAFKATSDTDAQIFGFTGVVNIQSGVHIGLTYGKLDAHSKNKIDYTTETAISQDEDYKSRSSSDEVTFLFGMPVGDNLSLGVEYAQISNKTKTDGSDDDSTSYQILRPGVTYYTQQFELGLVYTPPIEIHETDGYAEEPRQWFLHAQYRLADGRSAGAQINHYHLAGIDEDGTDYFDLKVGSELLKQTWGTIGLFGLYDQKNYMKKNNANGFTIPHVGIQGLYGRELSKGFDLNTGLTFAKGEAKADRDGESSKLSLQVVHLFASVSYQPQ